MISLSQRQALIAGLALIVFTNAVTLGLVAWNRSGEPEAVLRLAERELERPWDWRGRHRESSGLTLTLRWRVAPIQTTDAESTIIDDEVEAWAYGGTAHWLDDAKLTELGIAPPSDERRYRSRSHDALLVLEHDGDAYRRSLERARQHLARETALRNANSGQREFADRVERANKRVVEQSEEASRLFVVDAGRDAAALRAKYPDRQRYAIVAGHIRPGWHGPRQKRQRVAYIERIDAAAINVPHALRDAIPPDAGRHRGRPERDASNRFVAEIAFGRRLEPWLLSVTGTPEEAPTAAENSGAAR